MLWELAQLGCITSGSHKVHAQQGVNCIQIETGIDESSFSVGALRVLCSHSTLSRPERGLGLLRGTSRWLHHLVRPLCVFRVGAESCMHVVAGGCMTSPAGFGLGMADYFQSGLGPTSASQGKSPPDLEMDAEVLKADVADSALSAADVSLNPKLETLPVNRSSSRLRPRFLCIRTNICLHSAFSAADMSARPRAGCVRAHARASVPKARVAERRACGEQWCHATHNTHWFWH